MSHLKGLIILLLCLPGAVLAGDTELNGANTAWILTSTALVLFMTIPGLSFFYCICRSKSAPERISRALSLQSCRSGGGKCSGSGTRAPRTRIGTTAT